MDFEPRHLDGHLLEILSSLAELVMREIEQDLASNLIPGAAAPLWASPPAAKTLTTPTSTLDPYALASTGSLPNTHTYNRGQGPLPSCFTRYAGGLCRGGQPWGTQAGFDSPLRSPGGVSPSPRPAKGQ